MKKNRKEFKKSPDELREYLQFKRRGFSVPGKKGRVPYRRKPKYIGALDFNYIYDIIYT